MKTYTVIFTPEAEEQLAKLYRYIADQGSREIALNKGRIAIALAVEGEQVINLGVFYGGQDYESALRPEPDG